MEQIASEAERAGILAATQALMVGLLSTLRNRGVLSQQDLDQLFEAGIRTFQRGEPDEASTAAQMTLEIVARSLSTANDG